MRYALAAMLLLGCGGNPVPATSDDGGVEDAAVAGSDLAMDLRKGVMACEVSNTCVDLAGTVDCGRAGKACCEGSVQCTEDRTACSGGVCVRF
jgi:hypothetical protein